MTIPFKKVVVVYGSGSSYASGYQVKVTIPPWRCWPIPENREIPPPLDRGFFNSALVWEIAHRLPALTLFISRYFGVSDFKDVRPASPLGLEQVWSAADLSLRHQTLETFDWSGINKEYCDEANTWTHDDSDWGHLDCVWANELDTEPRRVRENAIGGTPFKFLRDCQRQLHALIYLVYGEPVPPAERQPDHFAALHRLLTTEKNEQGKEQPNGWKVQYITFNYDACLEMSLSRTKVLYDYVSAAEQLAGGGFPEDFSQIFKLHGSLTWKLRTTHRQRVTWEPTCLPCDSGKLWAVRPNYRSPDATEQPAIIPPTWFKQEINDESRTSDVLTQLILHQWECALAVLRQADLAVIVGYSFPKTDFHVERLFRLATMEKSRPFPILYCSGGGAIEPLERMQLSSIKVESVKGFEALCDPAVFKEALDRFH